MKTFISVYQLRNLIRQYDNEEITLSRFAEIINQDVNKALNLPHVGRMLVCETCSEEFEPIDKLNFHCQKCQPCKPLAN